MNKKTILLIILLIMNIIIPLLAQWRWFSILYILPLILIYVSFASYSSLLIYGILRRKYTVVLITIVSFLVAWNLNTIPIIDHYSKFYFNIELADIEYPISDFENYIGFLIAYFRMIVPINILLVLILKKLFDTKKNID